MILHKGLSTPVFPEPWDDEDKEWIWVAWDKFLAPGESIQSSTWTVPPEFTSSAEQVAATVKTSEGKTYSSANAIFAVPDAQIQPGYYKFTNTVVFTPGGRQFSRSVMLRISDL